MDSLCVGNLRHRVADQLDLCHTAHPQSRVSDRYHISYHSQVYKVKAKSREVGCSL